MTSQVLVTPAIDIQVGFSADGSRSFSVRFAPLPADSTKGQLDTLLDTTLAAIERQRAKFELEDEEAKLAEQLERIRKYEGSLVTLEEFSKNWWASEGRKGEWSLDKLTPNQKVERERLTMSLDRDRHDARALKTKIERLREKVDAADRSADCDPGDPGSAHA